MESWKETASLVNPFHQQTKHWPEFPEQYSGIWTTHRVLVPPIARKKKKQKKKQNTRSNILYCEIFVWQMEINFQILPTLTPTL